MGAEGSTPAPPGYWPQAPGTALQMALEGMLVRGDEGQGAHPGDPPPPHLPVRQLLWGLTFPALWESWELSPRNCPMGLPPSGVLGSCP